MIGKRDAGLIFNLRQPQGAYAQYIAVSSVMILRKPDHLSFIECAGIPENFLTGT